MKKERKEHVHELLQKFQPNATMFFSHMFVDSISLRERCKTLPADVRLALDAGHVVATFAAFYRSLTTRAIFDIMSGCPFMVQLVLCLVPLLAGEPIMSIRMATGTDANQTRWALENHATRNCTIYLSAVRSWAVVELVPPRVNV